MNNICELLDHELSNKIFWGKLQRAHPNKSGNFAPTYLGENKKLRAYLEVSLWLLQTVGHVEPSLKKMSNPLLSRRPPICVRLQSRCTT